MNVLITGAHGFVGKHVLRSLSWLTNQPSGGPGTCNIFAPDKDSLNLLDRVRLAEYLGINEINTIVHLAARVGGIGANKREPADFLYNNLLMGINVLREAQLQPHVKKVINVGTICSYPKFASVPFQESELWNGFPEETNAPYGIAKRAIIMYGIALNNQNSFPVVNLMPVNMAGEHDNFHPMSSHVIPAIILKIDKAMDSNKPFVELWGTGEATREFLYAGDFAEAVRIALTKNDITPHPINIGTGKEITIKDLAFKIKDMMDYDGEIRFTGQVSDGQPRRCLDVNKARDVLGFEAKTKLSTILLKEIEYYRAMKKEHPEYISTYKEMI